jgi:iron(III) transport system substrate-binding protein
MEARRIGGLMLGRVVLAVVVGCAALALASGCGDDQDTLTIYSGRTESLIGPLLEQFAEERDVAIDVRYGDSPDLALLIQQEGDQSPADVFWSQSPGAVEYLEQNGRLGQIAPAALQKVRPAFRDPAGRWVGTSGRERVLVYNADRVSADELPDSVLDLTRPEYRGRLGVAPENGSFQDFVTAFRRAKGDEAALAWLKGIAGNDPSTYANNNAIVEAAGRGEIDMGLVNHYYNFRFLAEDPDLPTRNHQFAPGDLGGLVIPSAITMLAGTDQQDEANALIEFMLTPEAQRYFASETFEYPLAADVEPAEGVPPLASLSPPDVDVANLGDLETTARLIQQSGLD